MLKVLAPKITHLKLEGTPPEAWSKVAKEVAKWKRQDLSTNPHLQVRTGQMRDSIKTRLTKRKNKETYRHVIEPQGFRHNKFLKRSGLTRTGRFRKPKRMRNKDLMWFQISRQRRDFMGLSAAQRKKMMALLQKVLTGETRRGKVRLDIRQK